MTFNSIEFVWFFIVVLAVFWSLTKRDTLRIALTLVASYYFYVSNNFWLIYLLLITTQVDYFAGILIDRENDPRRRKFVLVVSIILNLGLLAYYKYFNFVGNSIEQAAALVGWQLSWVDRNIILPVGISFYTFESMSYTIDVYRREMRAEKSWLRYSLFVAYFPHLVAGPIIRASELLHQFRRKPRLDAASVDWALATIAMGFVKKVVCGDYLAGYADKLFTDPMAHGTLGAWLGIYCFAFQIYFDFSGYSDIAIGLAKLMNFDLPQNFRRPYIARGFTDFWRRWHMTLSRWLRDYLYRPLGGNRHGTWMTCRNLLITMLLGGLWHGAAWHFIIWGLMHGVMLAVERFGNTDRRTEVAPGGMGDLARRLIFFHLVCLSWVAFRTGDLNNMGQVYGSLFRMQGDPAWTWGAVVAFSFVVLGWLAQYLDERRSLMDGFLRWPMWLRSAVYAACVGAIAVFGASAAKPFIYFQF
jgi:D-alanyl-lipoteichoic acid acyltransferase DltB (MBOAT superfamily)